MLSAAVPVAATATIGELQFETDFETLVSAARETQKPVVVKFYTDWCKLCRVLEDSTLPDPYVQKFLKNFELGSVNAEIDTAVAARYGVRSYPTLLLLDPGGSEIDRHVGFLPPEEFVAAVVRSLAGVGTLEDLRDRLAATPDDLELMYRVAEKHMYRGQYDLASTYFQELIRRDSENLQGLAAVSVYRLAYMKYKEKQYLAAADRYARVVEEYPDAEEAVGAELMVAYCLQQAQDFDTARRQYQGFLEKYPGTEEREWIEEQLANMRKSAD
jgi:thioredoxin-like negative regulator of GroEL